VKKCRHRRTRWILTAPLIECEIRATRAPGYWSFVRFEWCEECGAIRTGASHHFFPPRPAARRTKNRCPVKYPRKSFARVVDQESSGDPFPTLHVHLYARMRERRMLDRTSSAHAFQIRAWLWFVTSSRHGPLIAIIIP
jgi:hypothetical protein